MTRTDEAIETIARIVYTSMRTAAIVAPKYDPPEWAEHGNSDMQDAARRTAHIIRKQVTDDLLQSALSSRRVSTGGETLMSRTLTLWFFRDLSDEQRLKLFALFGLPVDEIGKSHGRQEIALREITRKLVEMVQDETATPFPQLKAEGDKTAKLEAERNLYKGKYRSIIALMDDTRQKVQEIADHIEDEGDRTYFGSSNHADWLRDLVDDMDGWSLDAMLPKGDINKMERDPYADCRQLRSALKLAVEHIEHMAAFIGPLKAGYSFESLGEDMPGIKVALAGKESP